MTLTKFSDLPGTDEYRRDTGEPIADWLYVLSVTDESTEVERANWDAVTDQLDYEDPYGRTYEIVALPHFKVTQVLALFVRPGSEAEEYAALVPASLRETPLLIEGTR